MWWQICVLISEASAVPNSVPQWFSKFTRYYFCMQLVWILLICSAEQSSMNEMALVKGTALPPNTSRSGATNATNYIMYATNYKGK